MGLSPKQSVHPLIGAVADEESHQAPQVLADGAAKVEELLALLRAPNGFRKLFVFLELQLEKQPEADAWVGTVVPCFPALWGPGGPLLVWRWFKQRGKAYSFVKVLLELVLGDLGVLDEELLCVVMEGKRNVFFPPGGSSTPVGREARSAFCCD